MTLYSASLCPCVHLCCHQHLPIDFSMSSDGTSPLLPFVTVLPFLPQCLQMSPLVLPHSPASHPASGVHGADLEGKSMPRSCVLVAAPTSAHEMAPPFPSHWVRVCNWASTPYNVGLKGH